MIATIRPEKDSDRQAVGNVNRTAFDTDAEANLVDALRDDGYVEVSLVAECDGQTVASSGTSRIDMIPIRWRSGRSS